MNVEKVFINNTSYMPDMRGIYKFKDGVPHFGSHYIEFSTNGADANGAKVNFPDYSDYFPYENAPYLFIGIIKSTDGTEFVEFLAWNNTQYFIKLNELKSILKYATVTKIGGGN